MPSCLQRLPPNEATRASTYDVSKKVSKQRHDYTSGGPQALAGRNEPSDAVKRQSRSEQCIVRTSSLSTEGK